MPGNSDLTAEQLASGFTVKQFSDETYTTEAPDGNYFIFTTSPSRVVTVYQLDEEGNRNELATGKANGTFKLCHSVVILLLRHITLRHVISMEMLSQVQRQPKCSFPLS